MGSESPLIRPSHLASSILLPWEDPDYVMGILNVSRFKWCSGSSEASFYLFLYPCLSIPYTWKQARVASRNNVYIYIYIYIYWSYKDISFLDLFQGPLVHDSTWVFPYHFVSWAVQLLLKRTFFLLGMGAPCLRGSTEPGSERLATANWWNLRENSFFHVRTCNFDAPWKMFIDVLGLGGGFMFFLVFSPLSGEDFHFWLILVETANQCIHLIFASSWFARRAVRYRHQRVYFPIPIIMGATKPARKNNSQQPPSSLLGSIIYML